jgi:hypothetical protein
MIWMASMASPIGRSCRMRKQAGHRFAGDNAGGGVGFHCAEVVGKNDAVFGGCVLKDELTADRTQPYILNTDNVEVGDASFQAI